MDEVRFAIADYQATRRDDCLCGYAIARDWLRGGDVDLAIRCPASTTSSEGRGSAGRGGSTYPREPGIVHDGCTYPLFPIVRDSGIFQHVAAQWTPPHLLLTRVNGTAEMVHVGFASFNFFDLLGVLIAEGRGFAETDDRRGATPVAILANRFWQRAFSSRPDAVGRTLSVAGKTVTIVGIAPPGFRGLNLAQSVDLSATQHDR